MTKRAVIYGRVSGDDRDKGNRNLDGQLEMGREYANQRGYHVVGELAEDDRGASGASLELPQLQKILTLAESGAIDVVIAREIDRLSRTLVKQLVVEAMLREMGVTVEYVLADYDDTPEGTLSKTIRAVISEYERLKIRERMQRGKALAVRQGRILTTNRPPYGYREREDGMGLVIHDEEADTVRQIYDWYIDDKLSYKDIAAKLTELRVPTWADKRPENYGTKTGRYGHWAFSSVATILKNATYTGTWRYHTGDTINVPVIVEPERWDAATRQRRINRADKVHNVQHDYLLLSRVRCGECGYAMSSEIHHASGKPYGYYRCARHKPAWWVPVRKADPAVWECIVNLYTPGHIAAIVDELRADLPDTSGLCELRDKAGDDIHAAERRHERLLDLYLHGDYTLEELETRRHAIDAELVDLRERWQLLTERINEVDAADPDDVAELFRLVEDELLGAEDFETRRGLVEELDVWAEMHRRPPLPGTRRTRWEAVLHLGDLGEIGRVEF